MDPLHIFTPLAHMQFQPSALRLGWKELKSKEEKEQKKNKDFALFMILCDSLALLFGPGARAHFRNLQLAETPSAAVMEIKRPKS